MEEDQRFAHVASDPKFRRIPKTERKVKIDKRFKSMFKDKNFKVKYTVDKRGRPVNHTSSEDLKRYYDLSSEESSSDSDNEAQKPDNLDLVPQVKSKFKKVQTVKAKGKAANKVNEASDKELSATSHDELDRLELEHNSDKKISDKVKKKLKNLTVDYARGESALLSDSSSDDDDGSESNDSEGDGLEHAWGELDRDAIRNDEITYRLAACNMDWDRIKAVDLMVLLNSFLPPGSLIESVKIYPSEFGVQRMKDEEIKGPTELVESKPFEEDSREGSKYHMEKLRQYQLNRLKYYYAVIVCDNENTANKIYSECDGLEYESSATKMDLRFIPNDMTFEAEPKEVSEKMPEPGKYQPRFFTTTALQQAKVDLTWDETNPDRIEITQKLSKGNVDDVTDGDLQAYLASSSGEEDGINELEEKDLVNDDGPEDQKLNSIDKYKALLQDIESREKNKDKKDVEMEISWGINLKEKTDDIMKKKLDAKVIKTPFQQYLDKRKEKQKTKREVRRKNRQDSGGSDSDIPSDIDMNDPYFAEEFDKAEFKRKKKVVQKPESTEDDEQKHAELELLLLNTEDDSKNHFSLQKIQDMENESKKKKKLRKKKNKEDEVVNQDDFNVNVADERFSALYSSHHFNLDPTDPHFKKTRGMDAIVNEKLKRRIENSEVNTEGKKIKNDTDLKKDVELSMLVKSVKRNTAMLGSNKKRN